VPGLALTPETGVHLRLGIQHSLAALPSSGRRSAAAFRLPRKSAEPDELLDAIRTVHRGDALLSPAATKTLITRFLAQPDHRPTAIPERLAALTDREREILVLVATGMTNDQIAAKLTVSPHTAKTHINRAMAKLGAHDRAQLVITAYETGLIRPATPHMYD
jgi:DNA-binding NarL/FixJ family response regulator